MIFIVIGWVIMVTFAVMAGYSLAMTNAHRRMCRAWLRCVEITKNEFPSHTDEEWFVYSMKITDQFKNW